MLDVRWVIGKSRRGVCWIYVVFLNASFWCLFGEAALFSLKVSALMLSGPSWRILLVRLGAEGHELLPVLPTLKRLQCATHSSTWGASGLAILCGPAAGVHWELWCFDIWWCWVMSQRVWCSMNSRILDVLIAVCIYLNTQHRCAGICSLHLRLMHLRMSNSPQSNSSASRITQTFFPAVVQENLMNEFGVPGAALVACGVLPVL